MKNQSSITGMTVASNLIWRLAERWGAQIVSFVVSIILARFLLPEDYGLIAIVTVVTSILNVFVDSGMASALIQKKNADDVDFSTVFYFNIIFCIVLYFLLFISAPLIGKIYHSKTLIPVLRILGLTLIIAGIKNTQISYVSKTMQFRRFFFATLGGTIVAAAIGITMAYHGYGVWALVAQQLINNTIDTVILWFTVKWRPKCVFSISRLKRLVSYGWKILVSNLLDTTYNNIRTLIIGVKYSSKDLGLYNKGKSFPWLIIENINSSLNSVLLPAMSKNQDNLESLKGMMRRSIKISTYIISPILVGLLSITTPLVRLLLTEKWLPCVPFMQIFCVTYIFYPIHTANLNAILAKGHSDIFLKLEVVKKIIGIIVLLISMQIGVLAMAYSLLITTFVNQILNSWPNKKMMNYGYLEQLKDITPSVLLSVGMGLCIYPIQNIGFNDLITVILQVIAGMLIYVMGSKLFKIDSFIYLWDMIKQYVIEKRLVN